MKNFRLLSVHSEDVFVPGSALCTIVMTLDKGLLRHFLFYLGFLNTFSLLISCPLLIGKEGFDVGRD